MSATLYVIQGPKDLGNLQREITFFLGPGKYTVVYDGIRTNGSTGPIVVEYGSFPTKAEAEARLKELEAEGWTEPGTEGIQMEKTIADYDKEIAENANSAEAYNSRGVLYLNKDQFSEAIADLTQAINLNPDFAEAYYNRGTALLRRDGNETDEVIADMKKAHELGLEI